MRSIVPLAGLVVVIASCDATTRGVPTITSPGGAAMEKGSNRVPDEGVRFISFEDMDPELAAYARRQLSDPEHLRETERAYEAQMRAGPLRFAFADGALPEGAVAAVVRNPSAGARRMLVFSEESITDRAISLARLALMEDEQHVPEVSEERVLLVWSDQRVRVRGQTKVKRYTVPARQRGEAAGLLGSARLPAIEVRELGWVLPLEVKP